MATTATVRPKSAAPQAKKTTQVTQFELLALGIMEWQLAQISASCAKHRERMEAKLRAGAAIEPGQLSLTATGTVVRS